MAALYPYAMHQQHRQRLPRPIDTKHSQEPGSSLSYPIVIPPSPSADPNPLNYSWNPPDPALSLESFAWPSLWFDVPSISPPASLTQPAPQSQTFDMFDTIPDLIHSDAKSPEPSPVSSMRDACITPAQDNTNVVAVCDVPLVAPRPLPFTPPAFLQFDCLPDEDEDLSFPPYTHSRRHLCATQHLNANPRKRPAPPPNTSGIASGADAEIESEAGANNSLPSISKKRRRLTRGENAPPAHSLVLAPAQSAVFINNSGESYFHPQLAHFAGNDMMGWI